MARNLRVLAGLVLILVAAACMASLPPRHTPGREPLNIGGKPRSAAERFRAGPRGPARARHLSGGLRQRRVHLPI